MSAAFCIFVLAVSGRSISNPDTADLGSVRRTASNPFKVGGMIGLWADLALFNGRCNTLLCRLPRTPLFAGHDAGLLPVFLQLSFVGSRPFYVRS